MNRLALSEWDGFTPGFVEQREKEDEPKTRAEERRVGITPLMVLLLLGLDGIAYPASLCVQDSL